MIGAAMPDPSVIAPSVHGSATSIPHVVIVGGGFGGLTAAKALRRKPVRVTLVDRQNHHLFQMLLYQVATAGLSPGDIASPIRWILRRQANTRVLMADVERVDVAGKTLVTDVGPIAFDYLILAPGVTHSYFGHDDWRPHAPGLKTLDDALGIRAQVLLAFERAEGAATGDERRRSLTFVIVGGGPTGVELAGSIVEIARHALRHEFRAIDSRTATVLLLEGGPDVLPAFPQDLRDRARRDLERLGVVVRTGAKVERIEAGVVHVGEERLEAGTILWAAGVQASPLGATLGVPLDRVGRVKVEPDLSVPGAPSIFVVGDLATLDGPQGRPLPGVASVAIQEAHHAVGSIDADRAGRPRGTFRYRNPGDLATIGRAAAVADLGWVRFAGWPAWLFWLFVHILKLTGFRNRLVVFVQWAWAYLTFQRSIRLITGRTGAARPPVSG
jgi:NADH dehydrogenase